MEEGVYLVSSALRDLYGCRLSQFLTSRRWNHSLQSHLIFLCHARRSIFFRTRVGATWFLSSPYFTSTSAATARQHMTFVRLVQHFVLEPSNYSKSVQDHTSSAIFDDASEACWGKWLHLSWSSLCSCFYHFPNGRSSLLLDSTELYYSKCKTTVLCGHSQKP